MPSLHRSACTVLPLPQEDCDLAEERAVPQRAERVTEVTPAVVDPEMKALLSRLSDRLDRLEQRQACVPPGNGWGQNSTPLFGNPAPMEKARLDRLRAAVGPPPPRLGEMSRPCLTEDLDGEALEGEDEVEEKKSSSEVMIARMLENQTKLLASCLAKKEDPMRTLLGGGGEDDAKISGARGCAAWQMMIDQMLADPQSVHKSTQRLLAKALRKNVSDLTPGDMLEYMESRVPFGTQKGIVYFAHLIGHLWAAAEENKMEEVKSLLARSSIFLEQSALEGGHYVLGWLCTGLEEPNWQLLEHHKAPKTVTSHARLAEPKLITANLAYLRDIDNITARTKQTHSDDSTWGGSAPSGSPNGAANEGGGAGAKAKAKGKPAAQPPAQT
eukprot:6492081-Amphidinium_carterae.1